VTPGWLPSYLQVRKLEGRLLSDHLVAQLPRLPTGHPLSREWMARADSSRRVLAYFDAVEGPRTIIDAGCGNGWLAAALAGLPQAVVFGVDANAIELEQGRRVFGSNPNLKFVAGDLETMAAPAEPVDAIVLASVIQYVADLGALIRRLLGWLADGGELHVLDSPIYQSDEVAAAHDRSLAHYAALGVPEMAGVYRHHTWSEFEPFRPTILHRTKPSAGRLLRRFIGPVETPFPWLLIRPERPA